MHPHPLLLVAAHVAAAPDEEAEDGGAGGEGLGGASGVEWAMGAVHLTDGSNGGQGGSMGNGLGVLAASGVREGLQQCFSPRTPA
jgi:hypothetical protein